MNYNLQQKLLTKLSNKKKNLNSQASK